MATQTFDARELRDRARAEWKQAADGWRSRADFVEAGGAPVTKALVEAAGIGPGHRVLDVATGHGEPALTIARIVGPEGSVVATDISPDMLDIARDRVKEAGLRNVELLEADDAALGDLEPASFDAVVCRFGLMYFPDPVETVRRLRTLLEPGGRLAASVWSTPDRVPFASIAFGVVLEELELPPPPKGRPGMFALAAPGALSGTLERAGLADVRGGAVTATFTQPSAEEWTLGIQEMAPPVTSLLVDRPADVVERVWAKVTEAYRAEAGPDGSVRLANEALWAAGTR